MDLLNRVWRDLNNQKIWVRAPELARDIYKNYYAEYRKKFYRARPFNVDNRALRVACELSLEGPTKMSERLCLGRLPFPEIWIEFDLHEKLRIGAELGISPGVDDSTPHQIGYLLQEDPGDPLRWSMITWVSVDGMKEPAHIPHRGEMLSSMALNAWLIDTERRAPPNQIGDILAISREDLARDLRINLIGETANSDEALRAFPHLGWGYGSSLENKTDPNYSGIDPMRMLGEARQLSNSINVGWEPMSNMIRPISHLGDLRKEFINSCIESRGDVRLVVTLLALINEVPIIETPTQQKGAFTAAGGTIRKYLTNKTITINIPAKKPMKMIRKILAKKAKSHKARHEVRGHWRTIIHKEDHTRKRKMPDGQIVEEFIAKGQLERVWVNHHERGDAGVGWVRHDYKVEKSGRSGRTHKEAESGTTHLPTYPELPTRRGDQDSHNQ